MAGRLGFKGLSVCRKLWKSWWGYRLGLGGLEGLGLGFRPSFYDRAALLLEGLWAQWLECSLRRRARSSFYYGAQPEVLMRPSAYGLGRMESAT